MACLVKRTYQKVCLYVVSFMVMDEDVMKQNVSSNLSDTRIMNICLSSGLLLLLVAAFISGKVTKDCVLII